MRAIASFAFLLLTATAFAVAADSSDEAVVALTTAGFDKFIKDNTYALVEFYAPWCGHCKNLAPHYEEAAKRLKKEGGVTLAKVDATEESELANMFGVRGYPTLKLFKNGEPMDYTGGRTADLIVQWVETMTGPAVEVMDESAANEKAKEGDIVFIANIKDKDSESFKLYEKVAETNRQVAEFIAVLSADAGDMLTVYRPEESPVKTTIGKDEEKLNTWISEERFPFFAPISGENYAAYEGRKQEIVWFAGSKTDFDENAKIFREVGEKYRSQYSFVWLDTDKYNSHAESGLGISEFPGLVLRLREGGRYVFPKSKFVSAEVDKFFKDIAEGKIEKFLKSEPIPETNDAAVKVVVGKNFDEFVFQKDKDVLLEIYAPWCGHCKRLEPIYTEFAEKLSAAGADHIVVAKMDGTVNEPPHSGFKFHGFPTIFWVKAGQKEPETFKGARTLEGLVEFVKKESSKPVELDLEDTSEKSEAKDEL